MDRRAFLSASIVSALYERRAVAAPPTQARLGGQSLEEIRDQYRSDLFEDLLPFMEKYVIDHELGGFMCNTDRDGTRLGERKTTWFEGRGIWVYSFLYRNFGRQEKHLEVARKSLQFILRVKPQEADTLWPESFTRDGRPLTPPATAIYGDLFVAEGLAEYARASGESQYWDLAKQIVLKCWRIYNRTDYEPNIVASYGGPKPIRFPGAKIQGVAMVMIRTISQMLEVRPDRDLERIIAECADAVVNKHYNPDFNLNNELLNHDYSRPTNELAQFVYTGHSMETLWMALSEALRRKDTALFQTAAERFRRHVEVAWDGVYGGIFRSLNHVDRNEWALDKALWAQEEALNGVLILIEKENEEWARRTFAKIYTYMREKFPLKPYGYALWMNYTDRKVTFQPHADRVENYHHPRHLMLTLLALDRIIQRAGHHPLFPS